MDWFKTILDNVSSAYGTYTTNQTKVDLANLQAKTAATQSAGVATFMSYLPIMLIVGGVIIVAVMVWPRRKD